MTELARRPIPEYAMEPEQLDADAAHVYTSWRNKEDQAIRIGIFGEDLEAAINDPDTIFIEGDGVRVPLLVPVETLEWYNSELLQNTYGEDKKILTYVHPPVTTEAQSQDIRATIHDQLNQGSVIVSDVYGDDVSSPIALALQEAKQGQYTVEAFGGETESRVDVFAGVGSVNETGQVFPAPSLYETYRQAVESGEIIENVTDGVSLQEVIEGEEAEELWHIYENPFEDLGRDDPTHAGFDKEQLLDILRDPSVTKVLNRVNGEITTLCFFLHDFEKAPWFNAEYYRANYPGYFETGNVVMFPGIVSDENKRGNNYATDVIDMASHLFAKRGSNILITFECTEISTTYIPSIVTAAIENSGVAKVSGLEKPISQINYYAISATE